MFEKASRIKLRFDTRLGNLNVEDLWDMSLNQLDELALDLDQKKESTSKSFLEDKTEEDSTDKLRFDIVLRILKTKQSESKAREVAADRKAKKEKLLEILAQKEEESLVGLDADEIRKMIEDLS